MLGFGDKTEEGQGGTRIFGRTFVTTGWQVPVAAPFLGLFI